MGSDGGHHRQTQPPGVPSVPLTIAKASEAITIFLKVITMQFNQLAPQVLVSARLCLNSAGPVAPGMNPPHPVGDLEPDALTPAHARGPRETLDFLRKPDGADIILPHFVAVAPLEVEQALDNKAHLFWFEFPFVSSDCLG